MSPDAAALQCDCLLLAKRISPAQCLIHRCYCGRRQLLLLRARLEGGQRYQHALLPGLMAVNATVALALYQLDNVQVLSGEDNKAQGATAMSW